MANSFANLPMLSLANLPVTSFGGLPLFGAFGGGGGGGVTQGPKLGRPGGQIKRPSNQPVQIQTPLMLALASLAQPKIPLPAVRRVV